jgi:hypothetical protein
MPHPKRDILNSIMSIGIMFLVGGCVTLILISDDLRSTKTKKENIRFLINTSVVNNNQTPTPVIKPHNNGETQTNHDNKQVSDTTEAKEANKGRRTHGASHCRK